MIEMIELFDHYCTDGFDIEKPEGEFIDGINGLKRQMGIIHSGREICEIEDGGSDDPEAKVSRF